MATGTQKKSGPDRGINPTTSVKVVLGFYLKNKKVVGVFVPTGRVFGEKNWKIKMEKLIVF